MSILRTMDFTGVYNTLNPPNLLKDRWGIDIKGLMIDIDTNDLYILNAGNKIIPLSTEYASVDAYNTLKHEVKMLSGNISAIAQNITAYIAPIISAQISGQVSAQVSSIVVDYIQKNSVSKPEYSTLSSSYDILTEHLILSGIGIASTEIEQSLNIYSSKFQELEDKLISGLI